MYQGEFEELREKFLQLIREVKLDEAMELYWTKLFPFVEKKFLSETKLDQVYDWLILPTGLESSYYILLIKAIKPKNVYFLGTEEFKNNFLDKVIELTGLHPSQYIIDTLEYHKMDITEVYEKIRKRLNLFEGKKVALDLTRGKRIISAGAGIVGAFFGFDIVYINEEWEDEIKRGLPGTEKLIVVKNPFEVFGDLERKEAVYLFNNYNYGAAIFLYRKLKEKIKDPREIEIEEILSEVYFYWNSFNFKAALEKLNSLIRKSNQYEIKIDRDIKGNLTALEKLNLYKPENFKNSNEEFDLNIIIDLYANALRKAEVGLFDDAVSRLYRVLELISQHRLKEHDIDSSNPELNSETVDKYRSIAKEIYGIEKDIPIEIGLKDGFLILFVLGDQLIEDENVKTLKDMFGVIRVRDTSIIAHGLQLIGEKAFANMNNLSLKFIKKICSKNNTDFNELLHQHKFIKLKE